MSRGDPRRGPRTAVGEVTGEDAPLVHAATVMLLRDGERGLEVLMLERHIRSEFAGGAYVFPGGKLDEADLGLDPNRWQGIDPAALARRMRVDAELVVGLHVAAVRETFEEAGVLLATRGGVSLAAADLAAPSFREARARMTTREERWDWASWLADEHLVLELGRLAWWSWWATPHGLPRRYDTRFFVAVTGDQSGTHDAVETTAARWVAPAVALDEARAGRATVVYPTRKNLEVLAGYPSADAAWQAARAGRTDTRRTEPEIVRDEDGRHVLRHPHTGATEPVDEPAS